MERQLEISLRKMVAFLDTHGFCYAIIGGIAAAQWGGAPTRQLATRQPGRVVG